MYKDPRNILLYFSSKYAGDYHEIVNALRRKEEINDDELKEYAKTWETLHTITIVDHDYPACLKVIPNPPIVLYLKGDLTLLNNLERAIAVIGAREYSDYGKTKTYEIVTELVSDDFTIISGLARGIDGFAHDAALKAQGKTIAILGSGINYPYPAQNKKLYEAIEDKGLIISEYPDLTKPAPDYFKFRNRLVAAFATNVLIIEAKYRSGTIITVGHALEKGSDIYCLPERAGLDSGTNKLIKDGAYLVESASDIKKLWNF